MCQKMKLLPKNDLGILKSYIYLHNIPTPCESGDFFDSEIYLGQTQSIVNKKIANSLFYLLAKIMMNMLVLLMKFYPMIKKEVQMLLIKNMNMERKLFAIILT